MLQATPDMYHTELSWDYDLNNLQPWLSTGGSLTITIPLNSRQKRQNMWEPQGSWVAQRSWLPQRSWVPQWEWFLYRLRERAKTLLVVAAHKELSKVVTTIQASNKVLQTSKQEVLEQNDALALRLQFMIRHANRMDLRGVSNQWEKEIGVQTEHTQDKHCMNVIDADIKTKDCDISYWLKLLAPSIAVFDYCSSAPLPFLVYDTNSPSHSQLRQRIVKIDCSHSGDPSEAAIESSPNWCKVVVPNETCSEPSEFQREFSFKDPEFNFELREDQMLIEGEVILVLYFDITAIVKRVARFPKHRGDIVIDKSIQSIVSPLPSSWAEVEEVGGNHGTPALSSDDASDAVCDRMIQSRKLHDTQSASPEKRALGHRQRQRRKKAKMKIPRTPSSNCTVCS